MSSIRSKPALILGGVLLLVFFLITKGWTLALRPDSGELLRTLFRFFHPAVSKEPVRWLAMESAVLLLGLAGATIAGIALSGRWLGRTGTGWPAIRAGGWRPALWAILIGSHGWSILSLLSIFSDGYGRRDAVLSQALWLLWYVAPVGSVYCAARLLFGRRAWRVDPWIGYVTAAAASFGIAWNGIMLGGFGDMMPLLGAFSADKLASGVTQLSALALGCAAAWTGLVLARRRESAMLGLRSIAPALHLLIGGMVLGVALTKLHQIDFVTRSLSTGQTAIYVALLALFAIAMALALANAAAQVVPAGDAGGSIAAMPRIGLLRRAGAALAAGRFWRDLFLSLAITLGLVGIAYMTVGQTPLLAAAFIMPLIIFGFLIGPIVMFVIGILRGRPGFAAAPVLLLVAIFSYRYANQLEAADDAKAAVAQAATFNVYPFAAPSRQHDVVVIEDSYDNRPDGRCSVICQQILLSSDYVVALPEAGNADWRVYRRGAGPDLCRQPAQAESYIDMLGSGRVGTCIVMTRERPPRDAMVIRENQSSEAPIKKQLPKGVGAAVYEFFERIDGKDRLLGRVVTGNVQPPLLSDQKPTETPLQLAGAAFYAAALKLPIADQMSRGNDPNAEILAALEPIFADPQFGKRARDTFRHLGGKSESDIAPKRQSILKLWESHDPESIKLGLSSLYSIRNTGLDFEKPGVAQFLASDDPVVMKAAVSALIAFDKDIEFAKAPLAELILSGRAAIYGEKTQGLSQVLKNVPGGYAEPARAQAKTRLATAGIDMSSTELLGLLSIVALGGTSNRQEAVDWIFGLEGERFERAVLAAREEYEALAPGISVRFWSEQEVAALAVRTSAVSDANLYAYVGAFRHQMAFNDIDSDTKNKVRKHIDQRVSALEDGSKEDRHIALNLRQLSKNLDR